MISYDKLPEHMQEGARLYVEHGQMSGGFFRAVVENDLATAGSNADGLNRAHLASWAAWLLNDAPMGCWGSPEKVAAWVADGGLEGLRGADR